jgi:glycosyltransferase involved in cell wall biosynthesis
MVLRVLINAGPWLPVPPPSYGGIENVLAALIPELRRRGVHVVLATVADSTVAVDEQIWVYESGQFGQLQRPYNRVMGIAHTQLQMVVNELRHRTDIDLVHDHVEAVGLAVLGAMGSDAPPVLHTLHWNLVKNGGLYRAFDGAGRVFVNGVSQKQLALAPPNLRAHSLGHVHNATPLAGTAAQERPRGKGNYVVVLGRVTAGKGQDIAARLARRCDVDVILAGPVGPYHDPAALRRALATDPEAQRNPDVRYWCEVVRPHVDGRRVRWVGSVPTRHRDSLVAGARATLAPLCWEEPGGLAAMESLGLGTPVVGYRRGCLPELVDHGRTGLLADPDDEDDLATCLKEIGTINSADCRATAAQRFAPAVMAERYLELYRTVLQRTDTTIPVEAAFRG